MQLSRFPSMLPVAALLAFTLACGAANARQAWPPDQGKFLATGGVSTVEGAGGGGLVPWALITGYGTRDSWGANVHATRVVTDDYALSTAGVTVGIADRVELSLASQTLRGSVAPLAALRLKQDIVGIKIKLVGEAVYEQDRLLPQIAIGAMIKHSGAVAGLGALGVTSVRQLGAQDERGVDYYVAATKLLFEHSVLLNASVRATKANQMGLLGFGGDRGDRYQGRLELSAAYLLRRTLVAGLEYRMKPRNLAVDQEKAYYDAFVAWFPSKNLSVTAAYAVLGDITVFNPNNQKGAYLSVQAGF
ncbi:DUF3034 family protein [Massilia sp. PWRC2]|uniref:DUF3034 family protein n=1 Tax=Massilia sp. PWRC2 TaxID=2804626 RepID=UPI003CF654B8